VNPKFSIGQKVYHITPDSLQRVVIDWRYYAFGKYFEYFVTFGPEVANLWYFEDEIA